MRVGRQLWAGPRGPDGSACSQLSPRRLLPVAKVTHSLCQISLLVRYMRHYDAGAGGPCIGAKAENAESW